MPELKDMFLLDPEVIFLNHGSFGATPRPVFAAYQEWQRRLEWQPVYFVNHWMPEYLKQTREVLGAYLNAEADDLVCVPNATFGVNIVARSLALGPGDEVLTTNHEYGACENTWQFWSQERGFDYLRRPIPLPAGSADDIVEQFWRGVTPRTRVIFLSHITSSTAFRFPVEAICARAREAGILTFIDGAHTPGQIPLNLRALDADFYTGNGHKWLCSPKGSAFLYARRELQAMLKPLVVGWGWGENRTFSYGTQFLDYFQWLGTDDLAAYLSFPAAIEFQERHDWLAVRRRCHALLTQALQRIGRLTGLESVYSGNEEAYCQMAIAPLPRIEDLNGIKRRLLVEYRLEVPLIHWEDRQFIRISIQAYNSQADVDALIEALDQLLFTR